MFDAKLLNSILNVNNNSFTDPLIIGAFEKRAHGFESLSGHLLDLFSVVPSFLATLLNSQLVASSKYLSGVPAHKLDKLGALFTVNKPLTFKFS